jgi:hypothetical protein
VPNLKFVSAEEFCIETSLASGSVAEKARKNSFARFTLLKTEKYCASAQWENIAKSQERRIIAKIPVNALN